MESITLQVGGSIISSGDALGQVQFAASAESDGGASRYIVGRIYGEAEGAFNASSNPASIVFATSAADNLPASGKIKISHEGHILPLEDDTYDLGEPNRRFRNLYLASGIAATGTFDTIIFNTGIGDIDQVAGQTNWNYEAGTLEIGLTNDLKLQVGQTVLFRVKNSTGSTLSKGQAVYASGVLGGGQIIQAAPFAVDNSVDEVRFIGLMTDDLANGEDGFVNHFGHIKNVDLRTSNTVINPNGETWAVGDILFVDDSTPGGLTKVPPQDDIYVALVLEDGQNGELFVRITDPGHIADLHDVNTSGLVDNNLLVWNSGADYWEPTTSMTFDGTTLHCDTDGITAKFGRDNAQTNGGKVRIYVDDADTAGSVQAIKAFNAKTTGYNYGINATANGSGATRNVGLYGWAAQATTNWGLWVDAGDAIFDERVGIGTSSPSYNLHVNGSGYVVNDFNIGGSSNIGGDVIVGGNVTIQGTTVTANVSSMEIEDPIFTLGQASGTIVTDTNLDRGLALVLSTGVTAFMGWDTSEGEFSLLSSGVATNDSGNYTPGTYGDLHIGKLIAQDDDDTTFTNPGTISLKGNTDRPYISFHGDDGSRVGYLQINKNQGANINVEVNQPLLFRTNNNIRMTIDEGGDVGIGTAFPTTLLDVSGVITASGGNSDEWNEAYDWIQNSGLDGTGSANHVAFWSDANTLSYDNGQLYWDSTNNRLGIGTTSPTNNLQIGNTTVTATSSPASLSLGGTYSSTAGVNPKLKLYQDASNNNYGFGVSAYSLDYITPLSTNSHNFYAAGSHIARISPTGVGIGTSSPTQQLDIRYPAGGGMALLKSGDTNDGLLLGDLAYSVDNSYQGIKHVAMTGSYDYMMISNGTHTFISAAAGYDAVIGAGGNSTTSQIRVKPTEVVVNDNSSSVDFRVESNNNANMLFVDGGNDRVGIGTASPSTQLDVVGSGNFSGDVTIDGHLSAATKSFLINHPTREGHKLQYGSLESPYHGVRLTGRARVDNGWCVVKLPEYISELVHNNNDINIQITNIKHSKVLYVDDTNIANNEFTVKTDSWFNRSGLEFYWTFTAVRKDVKELQVEF